MQNNDFVIVAVLNFYSFKLFTLIMYLILEEN